MRTKASIPTSRNYGNAPLQDGAHARHRKGVWRQRQMVDDVLRRRHDEGEVVVRRHRDRRLPKAENRVLQVDMALLCLYSGRRGAGMPSVLHQPLCHVCDWLAT